VLRLSVLLIICRPRDRWWAVP